MRFVCSQMFTAYLHGPLAVLKTSKHTAESARAQSWQLPVRFMQQFRSLKLVA